MPGRRGPRVPEGAATARHVDAAFGGGLWGAASVPSPVGFGPPAAQTVVAQQREVLFMTDVFPIMSLVDVDLGIHAGDPGWAGYYPDSASSDEQLLELTYTPIKGSIMMYLYRAGKVMVVTAVTNAVVGGEVMAWTTGGYTVRSRKLSLLGNKSFENGPVVSAVPLTWWIEGRLPRVEPGDVFVVQYAYWPDDQEPPTSGSEGEG